MNNIEKALIDDISLDIYLTDVTIKEFRQDVKELISEKVDKKIIEKAIKQLQEII